ncbi:hypothetical protein PR003_g24039 [Phytophthora rubi]|uniref:Secreted protein n=1 Tax=Phytophthora rubi TaxID=129364 RepID=A0A6A4CQB6_9STRA|nr:hypothetical protein PR002_g25142 [Phytophthora rubi]KAE8999019.1 hypothetical protein PR001_g19166 [Phytophthora rubi]KAE9295347.1 hypothetical protein PR003_g24039 [Phytophthora rubi]
MPTCKHTLVVWAGARTLLGCLSLLGCKVRWGGGSRSSVGIHRRDGLQVVVVQNVAQPARRVQVVAGRPVVHIYCSRNDSQACGSRPRPCAACTGSTC